MKQLLKFLIVLTVIVAVGLPVFAHGVQLSHAIDPVTGEITVVGAFDTGEPLANAQVIIFAPSDLVNPWRTDVADAEGQFTFLPDYTIEGYWDVQFRLAGHGGLVHIEVREDMTPAENAPASQPVSLVGSGFTPAQVVIMSVSIIWGFVGTAFYFAGRRSRKAL